MNKKLARICIYACVVLLALYVAKADEDFMLLYDFETPEQVQRFKGLADNKNSFTLVTAPEYTGSGQGAACFYAPPSGTGEHFWPRADGPVPEGKRDWGLYDELKMTIINPKDSDGKMGMNLYTASGIKIPYYSVPIPPGRSEFVWTLPDMAKGEDIVRIQFATSGTIERIVYLDDIRVTVSDASIITRLDALKKRMLREASPELWERAKMTEEIAALHTKIEAIGASGERPLQRAKQSQELLDSYLNLKKQLWATLCTQAVEKFDQAYPAEQVWGWGWTNGSQKVYRDDLPFLGEIGGRPLVKLARREREGVQLVLRSRSNLNNVQVSVIQPSIPGGKLHVTPLLVGHVKPPKPAYPVEYAQWHPDPLLPFVNGFELEANCWQAIWLDVRAVSDCPSGEYTFTFIAKAKNAPEIQVPVAVKVWGFELPKFPTQPSLVNYHSDGNITTYLDRAKRDKVYAEFRDYRRGKIAEEKISEDSKMLRRMEIATQDLLLEHNVTPAPLYVIHRRLIISDVQRWHDQGGKYFSITYLPPQKCDPGGPFESWVERLVLSNLAAQIPALKNAGLISEAYCYAFDEIGPEKFFAAKQLMTVVKEKYPELKIITTAYDRDFGRSNGLSKLVDIWCPQIERYVEQYDLIQEIRKSGKKIWIYSCLYDPGVDMLIEKPLTAARLLCGLTQVKYGADGFLYYGVNSGNYHQDLIDSGPLTTKHSGNNRSQYNGCGILIYPTTQGPAPSIRLKAMRDGFEDVEYWHLLQRIKPEELSAEDSARLQEIMPISADVMANLEEYDQTGTAILKSRDAVGDFLEKFFSRRQ